LKRDDTPAGGAAPPEDPAAAPAAAAPMEGEARADRVDSPELSVGALRQSCRRAFDATFWVFLFLAVASGIACWWMAGRDTVIASLHEDVALLVEILPRIMAAVGVAGLVQVLVPRKTIARALSEEAGLKGVTLAAAAGVVTPGGPMTSFPLVNALHAAGSGRSALVAYLTSWSVLGMQRILTWEVPLMGADFAIIRALASLPLPFIAAFMSRLVPVRPDEPKV
jgi:uncharacterized membrane protein YraQ (UPF0718 family)